jgi:hypothetical protein
MTTTTKETTMTTTRIDAEEMGAPDQAEIAAFQQAAADANMTCVRAAAKVADAREALAYASAEEAKAQAIVAKVNVTGAELQARVQFAREANGGQRLVVPGNGRR